MRQITTISLCLGMCYVILAGCGRQADGQGDEKKNPEFVIAGDKKKDTPNGEKPNKGGGEKQEDKKDPVTDLLQPAPQDEKQEKYEAALTEALTLLADQKLPQALVAMETARTFKDDEFIRGEIAKVKSRLDQDSAAKKTIDEIGAVLDDGKGAEAAKLAKQALKEFGGGDAAVQLAKLNVQANALQKVQGKETDDDVFDRLQTEGDAALKEKNLRAAAIAYEQALTVRDDKRLKDSLADLRASLEKYDSLRKEAAELRRDVTRLEDAIAALQEASKAWDTLQVRQEIDETTLALQKRRDSVSVADFDIRIDLGIPDAGKAIADEVLPTLKPRYDLVERGQIAKVLGELKFEQNLADDPKQQAEVGKLAKVRFIVLGSVQRLAGLSVNARLVDVRTGLVVQTAKIVAPTPEKLFAQLPELGKQLLMGDEEKMAYEEKAAELAKAPDLPAENAPLPEPPPAPVPDQAPPPPIVEVQAPPAAGGLKVDAFVNLPPPPAAGQQIVLPVVPVEAEFRVKHRLLHAVIALGDNFYRRGLYRDALRQFEFALTLSPGNFDLLVRIERCQPLAPPIIIIDQPVVIVRPRVAILNFLVQGDPVIVPRALGPWTAYNIAPYFSPYFDIADQNEIYWYMARMGLTLRDLMENPAARRWLGRALGVRYFVLGTIQETASFDVNTYLLDAEFGYLQGSGRVHVRNTFELKLRMGELAQLTMMTPDQRVVYVRDADRFNLLLTTGRRHLDRGEFDLAIRVFGDALVIRPGHIEVLAYLDRARHLHHQAQLVIRRNGLFINIGIYDPIAARRRAWELAAAAELARIRAAQEAAVRAEAERRLLEEQRRRAQGVLLVQARFAVKTKNFGFAINFFDGATAIAPPQQALLVEVAQARVENDRLGRVRAADFAALQEAALRKQREAELIVAQERLANERKLAKVRLDAERKIQEERDKAAAQSAYDEGERLFAKKNYDGALASLQLSRRLRPTPLVEALIQRVITEQATSSAKTDAERQVLEAKLKNERDRRLLAEKEAKRNQELYQAALVLANKALSQKAYDTAQAKFLEAKNLFQTDAVLTGLKQVESARAQAVADIDAGKQKALAEKEKAGRIQKLVTQGQAAFAAKNYGEAVKSLQQAKALDPSNVGVLAALTEAEQARDRSLADARRKGEDVDRLKSFQQFLKNGQANLDAKQYDAAVAALGEAVKLNPDDATAKAALAKAITARDATLTDAKAKEESRKKTEAYQKLLSEGRLALSTKRFDDAIGAFTQAQKLIPGDKTSTDLLKDAQTGRQAAQDALNAEANKAAAELKRKSDLKKLLSAGRAALNGKDLIAAGKAFADAAKLAPDDADVARAQADLAQAQKLAKAELDTQTALKEKAAKVRDLVTNARAALKLKDLTTAAKVLSQAKELAPTDPSVVQALADLEQARIAAQGDAQKLANFQKAMDAGNAALAAKKYADAVKAFDAASKLMPSDQKAQTMLAQAQKAWDQSKSDDARLQEYGRLVKVGSAALAAKKFAEAQKAYSDALKLVPGDPAATRGLQEAQRGLDNAKDGPTKDKLPKDGPPKDAPPKDKPPKDGPAKDGPAKVDIKEQFRKEFDRAVLLEKDKKYEAAWKAYQEALKLIPDDTKAKDGAKRNEFAYHMQEGQRHLDAKRYPDAVREFQAALALYPNDPTALKLLDRAKKKN